MPQENQVYDWHRKFVEWQAEVERQPPSKKEYIGAIIDILKASA